MGNDVPRIVEQDGRVVRIVAGQVEVLAELNWAGEEIILSRLSIDGEGVGTLGIRQLRELGRVLARSMGASQLRIQGTTRTTPKGRVWGAH